MAFTGPLEDRILIRELMGSYADATFRGDMESWLATWVEDCVWTNPGFELHGKAALRSQWPKLWSRLRFMTFFQEVGAIEVEGNHATARCYCREIMELTGGARRKVVGLYEDELSKQDGTWLFARRAYTLLMDEGVTPVAA